MKIDEWCKKIVMGDGGFLVKENREFMVFRNAEQRDIALVEFTIRALANKNSEGSGDVLEAVLSQRAK